MKQYRPMPEYESQALKPILNKNWNYVICIFIMKSKKKKKKEEDGGITLKNPIKVPYIKK